MRSAPRQLKVPGASPAMATSLTSSGCAPWRRNIFRTKWRIQLKLKAHERGAGIEARPDARLTLRLHRHQTGDAPANAGTKQLGGLTPSVLDRGTDALRRERGLVGLGADPGKRIAHGVGDGRRRGNSPAFTHALDAVFGRHRW